MVFEPVFSLESNIGRMLTSWPRILEVALC